MALPSYYASKYHRRFDKKVNGLRDQQELACKPGCVSCCQEAVLVSASEALSIADTLKVRLTVSQLKLLQQTAQQNAISVRKKAQDMGSPIGPPCVLLSVDGACSVYPHRPLACRRYTSTNVAACEARVNNEGTSEVVVSVIRNNEGVKAFNAHVEHLVAVSKDVASYELHAALAEALANPIECRQKWDKGEKIFSINAEYPIAYYSPEWRSKVAIAQQGNRVSSESTKVARLWDFLRGKNWVGRIFER